jgi:hypothetical protein
LDLSLFLIVLSRKNIKNFLANGLLKYPISILANRPLCSMISWFDFDFIESSNSLFNVEKNFYIIIFFGVLSLDFEWILSAL